MDLNEYQQKARLTAVYSAYLRVMYPTLGLAGEVGELCNKIKKVYRDSDGNVATVLPALADELGDVLWYVAQLATDLGLDLDVIASSNLAKLASRAQRNVLRGSGDTR